MALYQLESVFPLIENDLHKNNPRFSRYKNLTNEQYKALKDLKNNHDIIVKLAAKGSAIVIMNRDFYIQEGYSHLGNPLFYVETEMGLTDEIIHKVNLQVHDILQRGQITGQT